VIPFVSVCLAIWEAFALTTRRPTVTDYSRRWPEGLLVWAWLVMLAAHFAEDE
jgi:hypothetical protein